MSPPISGTGDSTWQTLIDVTGDGRADLTYKQNGVLWVARNLAGVAGTTTLGVAAGQLADAVVSNGAVEERSATTNRFNGSGGVTNMARCWATSEPH